ncbi:MAG: hypothetical protein ACE5FC_07410, partial [Myxococcota bacterium]
RAAEPVISEGPLRASQAYLNIGLASAAIWGMQNEDGMRASARALEIAEKLGDDALWANAAVLHGYLVTNAGRISEGCALIERGWEVADRLDHLMAGFLGAWFRASWSFNLGDPRDAEAWINRELQKPRIAQALSQRQRLLTSSPGILKKRGGSRAIPVRAGREPKRRWWGPWLIRRESGRRGKRGRAACSSSFAGPEIDCRR